METIRGHQGDVIFYTIEKLPELAKEAQNKPIALGEIHGHAHVLTGDVKRYEFENRIFYLVLEMGAILQHTNISNMNELTYKTTKLLPVCDHNQHNLPAGVYEFWIQNQYNPYKKLMEQVID